MWVWVGVCLWVGAVCGCVHVGGVHGVCIHKCAKKCALYLISCMYVCGVRVESICACVACTHNLRLHTNKKIVVWVDKVE